MKRAGRSGQQSADVRERFAGARTSSEAGGGGVNETLLTRKQVERRVGLSRSTIYARMKQGTFPKAIHDPDSTIVWWLESEVDAWIRSRVEANTRRVA